MTQEKFEALIKSYQIVTSSNNKLKQRLDEVVGQNAYLRKQLDKSMKQKQRVLESPTGFNPDELSEEAESQHFEYKGQAEPRRALRREWRAPSNFNDFRVDIPEFEGKLDLDEFLEWPHTVERILDYKVVPEDKKAKLVALRLRKYASLWWNNLCHKRIRERKSKIQTWEKMMSKFKARFLPLSYVQDSYSQLHNLTQGNMSIDEYTREFEKLLIKFDIQEPEEQTIVLYLGGLEPKYSNIIELQ